MMMGKLLERLAIVLVVAFAAIACVGLYVQWQDCKDSGGVAVRGMFGVECMKR